MRRNCLMVKILYGENSWGVFSGYGLQVQPRNLQLLVRLIVTILAIWNEISWTIWLLYCDHRAFTFRILNTFGCLLDVMDGFELMKHKFVNYTILHVYMCGFQITYGVKQYITCQRANYHATINLNGCLLGLELLRSLDICVADYHVPKYCKNLYSAKVLLFHLSVYLSCSVRLWFTWLTCYSWIFIKFTLLESIKIYTITFIGTPYCRYIYTCNNCD